MDRFSLRTTHPQVHQRMRFGRGLSLRGCRGIKAPCVSRLEAGRKGGEQSIDEQRTLGCSGKSIVNATNHYTNPLHQRATFDVNVWERVLALEETPTIVPFLMCPDDCDFSCTIIVVEVIASATTVSWQRVGYAVGETAYETLDEMPASRLNAIDWLETDTTWHFERTAYIKAIQAFAPPELNVCLNLSRE
ncbi:hypothetical protein [Herpetosiphon llansteffanensis]|uniref:hypothetical protein n=1 Tax=Herpetosiphon llansteffanensis TaxID=2094568 RepID=UPI000F51A25D|nr:hypothetical protein [Herpetosiphon llansteffanensis]